MEITFIGYIAIALTIYCIFKRDKIYLLLFSIFFSGFSGSSVVNFPAVSIQPSFYFLILYIILVLFDFILCKRKFKKNVFFKPIIVFFIYCVFSIIFPFILEDNMIYLMGQDGEYIYLKFSMSNVIHIGYLFLGFFTFTEITTIKNNMLQKNDIGGTKNDTSKYKDLLERFYKYYKVGLYAVILICIYQIFAFKINLPFDELFRQGVNGNIQGTRLYGPCVEASMLCYYLVPSLLLVWINEKNIVDYIFLILGCMIGFMTYSSTFIIGLLSCIILLMIINMNRIINAKVTFKKCIIFVSCLTAILIFFVVDYELIDKIFTMLIDKINGNNSSGIERWSSFKIMSLIGLENPFGVGFGSSRSKDLFSTWLCNIGVVGMLLFFYMLIVYIKYGIKNKKLIYCLPYLVVVILLFISVSEPYNIFIWVLMAFGFYGGKRNETIDY